MAGLDHVNVVVSDMDRSVAFYSKVLGLRPVMDRRLCGDWFERVTNIRGAAARCVILDAPDGQCRVELLCFEAGEGVGAPQGPSAPGLRHFAIRVTDLGACLARLGEISTQGVEPVEVPHDIVKGGKRMCYIKDPDGALVELCDYGLARPQFI